MRLEPIPAGTAVRLTDEAAAPPRGAPSKEEALAQVAKFTDRMDELQEPLYAEGKRALLVVPQARDASGKDGTIRRVFGPLKPPGCAVTSFNVPTHVELAEDYLWPCPA